MAHFSDAQPNLLRKYLCPDAPAGEGCQRHQRLGKEEGRFTAGARGSFELIDVQNTWSRLFRLPHSATGLQWFGYALSLLIHLGVLGTLWRVAQVRPELYFQVKQGKSSIQLTATFATPASKVPNEISIDLPPEPVAPPLKADDVKPAKVVLERATPPPIAASTGEVVVEQAVTVPANETTPRDVRAEPPPEPTEVLPRLARQQPKASPTAPSKVPLNSTQSTGSMWDLPPRPLPTNRAPAYPAQALSARQQGKVVLLVAVKSDGTVGRIEISTSSGFRALDDAATEAVRQWRFSAARLGTDAVMSEVLVPVVFQLR